MPTVSSPIRLCIPLALVCLTWASTVRSQSPAEAKTVAGKTVEQYAKLVESENRTVRLRAAKSLGAFGQVAGKALTQALGHTDRAVQYTAAVHLGRIGGDALRDAKAKLAELAESKQSLALRMAGAFALCKAGETEKRLAVLTGALTYPDRGTACSAAELIGMLGPDAKAAIAPLEAVYVEHKPGKKGGDYHIGGAANNALRKIRGE